MLSDSAAQLPTMSVSARKKKYRPADLDEKRLGVLSNGPKPSALWVIKPAG